MIDMDPLGLGLSHEGRKELSSDQLERLQNLQNPNALYDESGKLLEHKKELLEDWKSKKYSYFIFKSWRMPISSYINILLIILVIAMFVERFCFAVVVYKTKNYGMVLILIIIMCNTAFLYVIKRLKKNKNEKRLHELYNINRTPRESCCSITLVR